MRVRESPAPFAWRGTLIVSGALALVLMAFSTRYGYHRDELYFLIIGAHPAFGYVDQPPLIPMLAHAMDAISGGSLFWLRVPPALASAGTAVVCAAVAREFGARASGQVLAAGSWAISAVTLSAGHLAGTTAFDLLMWATLTYLSVRALRDGGSWWCWAGVCLGLGLQIKSLIALAAAALVVGVLVAGPRAVLRTPWFWLGAGVAVLVWTPNLVWQALNGWPQLALSGAIAAGSSGTSEPRWLFLPFQFVLLSPVVVPIWALGWWRLWRDARLRVWRCFAVAFLVLAMMLLIAGGKPYYLCGMYPVLLAAGAQPIADRVRVGYRVASLGIGLAINVLLFVPVVPVSRLAETSVVAANYDAGETVGWPEFARTVQRTWARAGEPVVITANYGEAGALRRFAPQLPVYSGHNSLWTLGPPPSDTDTAILVGFAEHDLEESFGRVRLLDEIETPYAIDNDENGAPLWLVEEPREEWPRIWDQLRRMG